VISWVQNLLLSNATLYRYAAVNDYQKQLQFEKLNAVAEGGAKVRALRDGSEVILNVTQLLVGKVVSSLLSWVSDRLHGPSMLTVINQLNECVLIAK
jgi:hypothetical protein